jgi:vibriolysin
VSGNIGITPGAGQSVLTGNGTVFTMTAPSVDPQPGCTFVYTWSFGDGASASGASVTHQYQKKGNGSGKEYTVTLAISTVGVPQTWVGTKDVVVNP